jgi:hypothetical protein
MLFGRLACRDYTASAKPLAGSAVPTPLNQPQRFEARISLACRSVTFKYCAQAAELDAPNRSMFLWARFQNALWEHHHSDRIQGSAVRRHNRH